MKIIEPCWALRGEKTAGLLDVILELRSSKFKSFETK